MIVVIEATTRQLKPLTKLLNRVSRESGPVDIICIRRGSGGHQVDLAPVKKRQCWCIVIRLKSRPNHALSPS